MRTTLEKRNPLDGFPAFFEGRGLFKGFDTDFDKILNGKCDFEEDCDKYSIELEVPGVKKEEVDLKLKNGVLNISWNRKFERKAGIKKSRYERSEGIFTRSFDVEGVNPDKIEAELKNGILKIVLQKEDSFKPKKIEIK
jgi:HSP20 family protein